MYDVIYVYTLTEALKLAHPGHVWWFHVLIHDIASAGAGTATWADTGRGQVRLGSMFCFLTLVNVRTFHQISIYIQYIYIYMIYIYI